MFARENNTIIFHYDKNTMFDIVSLRTIYRAKNIKNEKGESMIDDLAITDDETDAFEIFMRRTTYDAFQIVLKMTTGVSNDPIFIDETITINNVDYPHQYGFKVVDNQAYNDNNLYTVDDGVQKFIEASVLEMWYELVGVEAEYERWALKKAEYRKDLITNRLFQLKKPLIS